jgi:RNA polymerase sigma factor (sigma-70 family)
VAGSVGSAILGFGEATWRQLRTGAKRQVGCPIDAEDALQEGCLRLLESERRCRPVVEPVVYLGRIVRNLAIDQRRRRAREARLLRRVAEGGEELGDRRSPEDIVVEREALSCLAAALDALPARTRAAFELHRLAGLDQASIARRLEISQSLAHRLIKDALTHCREALERADRGLR